uniref:enoyl-CoA hydratase/isomerase family protein n=1 Tax=Pararhizobium sp. IMCC3301 TaxID=3067904 RepID=UPI00274109AA|nr:enoyl-CoA hydratase/isomerase family protein [Pararhizobium sp. IMCC3301]
MDGQVKAEILGPGIGLITIDRPAKRNAMTPEMVDRMETTFSDFDMDDAVRVIIITGAGDKAFCAGHDIKDIPEGDLSHLYGEEHMKVFLLPRDTLKPVICAVNGSAFAGGFCLALASDFRLATPEAVFAVPGPRLGIVPIAGQSSRLPRILPPAIANEVIMAGRPLSATRAEHFGFVNAVVPREQLLDEAITLAKDITGMSQFSVESYKRISRESLYQGVEAADAMEYWLAMAAGQGEDVKEGLAAFAEKRAPNFTSGKAKT